MAQTYKFGNGQWATKKGSTLAYNDENGNFKPLPFTFVRDTGATRVNKEGLIEVVSNDIPRIDYTDSTEGALLLEPSRTNYVEYSSDASQWSNVVSNGIVTKTTDYAISPDGTQNATRLQASVSGSGYALISLALTSAFEGNYTSTVYVKSNTENNQDIVFYGRNTDLDKHTVTKEWTRLQFKGSSTSGQSNYAYIGISTGIRAEDNPIDILVWGGQLEQGSYPTSYIPTNGSIIQRAAETCNGSGNSEVFNDSEGVLYADISALDENAGTERYIYIGNGTTANRIVIRYSTTENDIRMLVTSGGSTQVSSGTTNYNITENHKIALKYKANDFALWIDGVEVLTDTNGSTPTGINQLTLSYSGTQFYGKTKQIQYYDEILTDAELEYLTSYRSLNEMVTELNLNAL